MSKDAETYARILGRLRERRRHRKRCFALHLHFSKLERLYQEPGYRRRAASAFQPLIRSNDASSFLTESGDMFVVTGPASLDDVDRCVFHVREILQGSNLAAGPHAVGADCDLVTWYALETDFDAFEKLVTALQAGEDGADQVALKEGRARELTSRPPEPDCSGNGAGGGYKGPAISETPTHIRTGLKHVALPGDEEASQEAMMPKRFMDMDAFKQLVFNLMGADIEGMMVREDVFAKPPGIPGTPVMVHRHVPFSSIIRTWFGDEAIQIDPWFKGYISDLVADRVLACLPAMTHEKALASSVRATSRILNSPTFERFHHSLGDLPRKRVIFELSAFDAMSDPGQFMAAVKRVRDKGFRVQLADVDSRAFLWLHAKAFDVSFVKLTASHDAYSAWLAPTKSPATEFRAAVRGFSPERVILDNCVKESWVAAAQKMGLYMFMGPAVS